MSNELISEKYSQILDEQSDKKSVLKYPRTLYPPIEPYKTQFLKVSDIHTVYLEESGNPEGNPVIVVHGGPGGGCEDFYRQYFDPQAYRIIMFDQRGCGKSTPFACLDENDTWSLVEDMEKIRVLLDINKWVVFGGSWGSTLSLAYAQTHPSRVKALILRGIFTLRREELIFFYQQGTSFLFPDFFDEYVKPIPLAERHDLISAYHRRLTGKDEKVMLECAMAWSKWEMATSKLIVDPKKIAKATEDPKFALAFARIENHYFVNAGFFREDGQLINDAHILKNIPGVIVHGRYDVVCPIKTAWDLKKVWGDNVDLIITPDAGHSMAEAGNLSALVDACDKFKNI
ncbi:hypothetical protein DICPUDRAFT_38349 [Dictyostelium purpureum]|uniref:Proline iminopeptidase n=1 Tax=Dictyostelium purpureum TaxID=5786 RepID=F0ZUA8_DICPU|nr:uncharacterized protein DICPUDRAFT_38349 [Dictyostelium purpureum]EGC32465.1 hypothetical protein DICPUDRAFT_38349 [Dictyostelium purpureum]|eukprot:XP_003290999.1 hypothetical protein DICPUDRAFT_38349 [Dictyostelium purpureum]